MGIVGDIKSIGCTICNKYFSDNHLVLVLAWRALKTRFYELRMVTIGQDCSVVCINEGGHRDAISNNCSEHAVSSSCIAYWPYYLMTEHTCTYNTYFTYFTINGKAGKVGIVHVGNIDNNM